jgi:hypothetical protein
LSFRFNIQSKGLVGCDTFKNVIFEVEIGARREDIKSIDLKLNYLLL